MEFKAGSSINIKSNNSSGFGVLNSFLNYGTTLTPERSFWLWQNVDTISRAVELITDAYTEIETVLIDKKTNSVVTDHPYVHLMKNPGPMMSEYRYKTELMTSYCVSGECYPVAIGNTKYEPFALYSVYANKVTPIRGSDGWLGNMQFSADYDQKEYRRVTDKRRWLYRTRDDLSETVQIIKQAGRHTPERGKNPIESIYYQSLMRYYGQMHNSGLLKNGSRPGGLWSPRDKETVGQKNYEIFKEEILSHFTGPQNSGKNIISPIPIEYQNFLVNARDMDFVNLMEQNKEDIYSMYNIPLAYVSTKAMTLDNYKQAVFSMYDQAILTRTRFLNSEHWNFLRGRYKDGDRFESYIDEKQLPALRERLYKKMKLMRETNSFSLNEIRTEGGAEAVDGGDVIMVPSTLIPFVEDQYTEDNLRR